MKHLAMDQGFPIGGRVTVDPLTVARVSVPDGDEVTHAAGSARLSYSQASDVDLTLWWNAPDGRRMVIARTRQAMVPGAQADLAVAAERWPISGGSVEMVVSRAAGTGMVHVSTHPSPALVVAAA